MPKKIKSKQSHKESFFSKLATLLAPMDDMTFHGNRHAAAREAEAKKEPARQQCYPSTRPMQVIKI